MTAADLWPYARLRTYLERPESVPGHTALVSEGHRALSTPHACWLVATTRPHRESWAAENCAAQGFDTYRPHILRRAKLVAGLPHRFVAVPLFPNYLFVKLTEDWPRLLGTFGISGVIRFGDKPSTIPDQLVTQLKAREVNGIIQLPKLQPGQRVTILRGSFANYNGLYQGMASQERVRVLLDVLGRQRKVFVAADAVGLAA